MYSCVVPSSFNLALFRVDGSVWTVVPLVLIRRFNFFSAQARAYTGCSTGVVCISYCGTVRGTVLKKSHSSIVYVFIMPIKCNPYCSQAFAVDTEENAGSPTTDEVRRSVTSVLNG